VSSPIPTLNLSPCSFILTIAGEMVTRVSFASRGSVRREWQRLEHPMQMPRAKAIVRTVPAWGDRKVAGGAAGRATPIRSV
jgi:hypothetical protein